MIKPIALVPALATLILGVSLSSAAAAANQPDQVIAWNQELQKVLVAPGAQPAAGAELPVIPAHHVQTLSAVRAGRAGKERFDVRRYIERRPGRDCRAGGEGEIDGVGELPPRDHSRRATNTSHV